jgi:glycosyltransferase involved in cell wall biosynthesis
MIEACNMLPEVDFVFAGKGDFAEEIQRLQYVTEVGFRTGEDLDLLIRNAMFTVYPSEWYENNPFSVMESQERLVPVVGADIGGIPELIRNGVDGMLFESGNAVQLADKIKILWDNPEVIGEYKKSLAEIAGKRLDLEGYTRWIEEIYQK